MRKRLAMIACALALLLFLTIQASAQKITIRGHLERTVEAGGWLIVSDTDETTTKYLLLNAKQFQKKSWFRTGAYLEATGEVKRDAVTIYQQGVPFEASTIRALKVKRKK